jgi:hypothetical protein
MHLIETPTSLPEAPLLPRAQREWQFLNHHSQITIHQFLSPS